MTVASLLFLDLPVSWILILGGVLSLYVAALGSLGAVVGGSSARRHASP